MRDQLDAFARYFEVRSLKQVAFRTAWLTCAITAAAVVISDIWLRVDFPQIYPVLGFANAVSTVAIGFVLAGPLLLGFNIMALRLTETNDRLALLASRDPLTGMMNRRALDDAFQLNARKARRHDFEGSLLVIDADYFKSINDAHGHEVGDRVLMHLASVITAVAGPEAIVARLGGEEFAVVTFDGGDVRDLGEKVRAAVASSPFWWQETRVPLAISVGAVRFSPDDSLRDALRLGDNALYAAKSAGRNRVCTPEDVAPSLAPEAAQIIRLSPKRRSRKVFAKS